LSSQNIFPNPFLNYLDALLTIPLSVNVRNFFPQI
jgi:hypothetical protein